MSNRTDLSSAAQRGDQAGRPSFVAAGRRALRTSAAAAILAAMFALAAPPPPASAATKAQGSTPAKAATAAGPDVTAKPLPAAAARRARALLRPQNEPFRIVFESLHHGNWDLWSIRPDGTDARNLTHTADLDEMYPHVSPDGTKVCFSVDHGPRDHRVRSVYYMNLDGTGRTKVADNARQACWSPDSKTIAFLRGEFKRYCLDDYATKGLFFYDLATGKITEHPDKSLYHLYNICWSPDGKWFVSTVHAGMGFRHAIIAFRVNGKRVYNLHIPGCRPDLSPDGRHIAWGASDLDLCVADIDFSGERPIVSHRRVIVHSEQPIHVYHIDWSPNGKRVAFSYGPATHRLGHAPEIVGVPAHGWNIAIADPARKNAWLPVTTDGHCNKEPDWMIVRK